MKNYQLLLVVSLIVIGSCKPKPVEPEVVPVCPSTIYGYVAAQTHPGGTTFSIDTVASFGTLNLSTPVMTSISNFQMANYGNTGAWNTNDKCYYTFHAIDHHNGDELYKFSADGKMEKITPVSGSWGSYLVYNRAKQKLYCLAGRKRICEIQITGNVYTMVPLGVPFMGNGSSLTVDNKTGDFYYCVEDSTVGASPPLFRLEKYTPGSAAPVTLQSMQKLDNIPPFVGLQFSTADNKLYCIKTPHASKNTFMRIDPINGLADSLCDLQQVDYFGRHSSCIDSCSGTYIISNVSESDKGSISQISLATGQLIRTDIVKYSYLGLTSTR